MTAKKMAAMPKTISWLVSRKPSVAPMAISQPRDGRSM